ncbi:MAG: dihydroorotase [Flavobacterium sp.]
MKIIIKAATIIDAASPFNNKKIDLLIEDGVISNIAESINNDSDIQELTLDNLHISSGWFDSSVSFGEPGYEDRETISNGLMVAAKSGFTAVALQPNSTPIIDNQSQVAFVKSKSNAAATDLYPIGAFTKASEGKDLAEIFDMKNAGAIAFGDYNKSISNSLLFKIGLQYAQDFDGLIIAFCEDKNLRGAGIANEGIISTQLGMKGIPNLAEEVDLAKNLFILEYTGGKLHIPTISTAKSVELIREAKNKGLKVTCSVSVHQLTLTDETLQLFDTRFKVSPPLREELDRKALIEAVLDGTIDMITSDHNPIDIEHKKMEFDMAMNGTIGLESAFAALQTVLPTEIIVEKLTAGKSIFGIESSKIEKGAKANLTLFTTTGKSTFTKQDILSKSKNSAFLGFETQGKVYGILNNAQLILK